MTTLMPRVALDSTKKLEAKRSVQELQSVRGDSRTMIAMVAVPHNPGLRPACSASLTSKDAGSEQVDLLNR